MIFEDRVDAGIKLAEKLIPYKTPQTVIVAIPRGGVVVGFEIATAISCPLDIVVPRKIGAPGEPELAIGAVTSDSVVLDQEIIGYLNVSQEYNNLAIEKEREEIHRRVRMYRGSHPAEDLSGKTVVMVDDGIATGYTMTAAVEEVRAKNPTRLIIAAPVASHEAIELLGPKADEMVILEIPEPFFSVGSWYNRFDQTTDEEVIMLMDRAARRIYAR